MNTQIYITFFRKLCSKYEINPDCINITKVIKRIPCHLLNQIIDNEIYYENKEYLKAYFSYRKCQLQLNKRIDLFTQCAQLYPNYSLLPEARFLYWNINHKQQLINQYEELQTDKEHRLLKVKQIKEKECYFFSHSVLQGIYESSILLELLDTNTEEDYNKIEIVIKLIDQAEEKRQSRLIYQQLSTKQDGNISSLWMKENNKSLANKSTISKYNIVLNSSNPQTFRSVFLKKVQRPQINIKMNFINLKSLNHTTLNTPPKTLRYQSQYHKYNNQIILTNRSLQKKIDTNRTHQFITQCNSKSKQRNIYQSKKIINIPSFTIANRSPKLVLSTNTSILLNKGRVNETSVNTSRTATIPNIIEKGKSKVLLKDKLKLNPKIISKIKSNLATKYK